MDRIVGRLKAIESVTGKLLSSPSISGTIADLRAKNYNGEYLFASSQKTQVIRIEVNDYYPDV